MQQMKKKTDHWGCCAVGNFSYEVSALVTGKLDTCGHRPYEVTVRMVCGHGSS